jgi:hypothetical protein
MSPQIDYPEDAGPCYPTGALVLAFGAPPGVLDRYRRVVAPTARDAARLDLLTERGQDVPISAFVAPRAISRSSGLGGKSLDLES